MSTIGASAPSQHTINYDALLTTTLFNYSKVMFDNIFKHSAFLAALRQYDGVETQDGGERIQRLLMYEDNQTFASFEGYDIIDTTPQDGLTSAFYRWAEIGGSISISRREERQNSGEAAIMNLFEQKVKQAEMSAKQLLNEQIVRGTVSSATFVPGNNAKDVYPLGYFLRLVRTTDPTAGGNVGNISGSTYSWWRHRSANFNGAAGAGDDFGINTVDTYAEMRVGLYRLWNWCSRGADGSGPNIILCDQVSYETYENSLDQLKRYGDDKLGSMGFDTVKLKGGVMLWDELVPDLASGTAALTYGTVFMLNTKFFKLVIDKQSDFITTPFVMNQNQTAKVSKVLFMGNTTCSNLRKLGQAHGVSLSIVS